MICDPKKPSVDPLNVHGPHAKTHQFELYKLHLLHSLSSIFDEAKNSSRNSALKICNMFLYFIENFKLIKKSVTHQLSHILLLSMFLWEQHKEMNLYLVWGVSMIIRKVHNFPCLQCRKWFCTSQVSILPCQPRLIWILPCILNHHLERILTILHSSMVLTPHHSLETSLQGATCSHDENHQLHLISQSFFCSL